MKKEILLKGKPVSFSRVKKALITNTSLASTFVDSELEFYWQGLGLATAGDKSKGFAINTVFVDVNSLQKLDTDVLLSGTPMSQYINSDFKRILPVEENNSATGDIESFVFHGVPISLTSNTEVLLKDSGLSFNDRDFEIPFYINGRPFATAGFGEKKYLVATKI